MGLWLITQLKHFINKKYLIVQMGFYAGMHFNARNQECCLDIMFTFSGHGTKCIDLTVYHNKTANDVIGI